MGIGAGFYLLLNGNPFDVGFNTQATSVIAQLNPDITQVPATHAPITPDNTPNHQTFTDILSDMNSMRQDAGLSALTLNTMLNHSAAEQARYNASIFSASHEDANGDFAEVRVSAQGYAWRNVGENLLANWSIDGHEVFALWRNSPSHYSNMMNPAYTEVGLAYMVTPIGQVYHAMVLARPID